MRRSLFLAMLVLGAATSASAADKIFDPTVLHEIRIVMDPADWKALQDNFLSDQYYGANVSIDGETIQQIGIRSAGQGSRSATKPYVKLDFVKFVKAQTFHGLLSVRVKNMVQDQSMLRDYLAMTVFTANGIPAPAYSFAVNTVMAR
jgi:spore coat protein CotH